MFWGKILSIIKSWWKNSPILKCRFALKIGLIVAVISAVIFIGITGWNSIKMANVQASNQAQQVQARLQGYVQDASLIASKIARRLQVGAYESIDPFINITMWEATRIQEVKVDAAALKLNGELIVNTDYNPDWLKKFTEDVETPPLLDIESVVEDKFVKPMLYLALPISIWDAKKSSLGELYLRIYIPSSIVLANTTESLFVVTPQQTIIASQEPTLIGKELEKQWLDRLLRKEASLTIGNQEIGFVVTYAAMKGPVTILVVLIMGIFLMMFGVVVRGVGLPIFRFVQGINEFKSKGIIRPIDENLMKDEFQSLAQTFNAMTAELQPIMELEKLAEIGLMKIESTHEFSHKITLSDRIMLIKDFIEHMEGNLSNLSQNNSLPMIIQRAVKRALVQRTSLNNNQLASQIQLALSGTPQKINNLLEFQIKFDGDKTKTIPYAYLLESVLFNLIDNALKKVLPGEQLSYTTSFPNNPSVCIIAKVQENKCNIEIRDNGEEFDSKTKEMLDYDIQNFLIKVKAHIDNIEGRILDEQSKATSDFEELRIGIGLVLAKIIVNKIYRGDITLTQDETQQTKNVSIAFELA